MEFLIDFIGSVIPYIKAAFLAIIPLGFLIFIHELGHFYAAETLRYQGQYLLPRLRAETDGVRRGETEYKISLLPFGDMSRWR